MRLEGRVIAIVLTVALILGGVALIAAALQPPRPTTPEPVQMRDTDGREEPPVKEKGRKNRRRPSKPSQSDRPSPAPSGEGAQPVAPPPPPAGVDDDDDDDDEDDDGESSDG